MKMFLYVGLGGALGAMARYGISLIPAKGTFPILTLVTNLLGAILIGVIVGVVSTREVPAGLTMFLKTGFCGGFTTFSTFSLETLTLFENHQYGQGTLYAGLSLVLCVLGVLLGKALTMKALA